MNGRILGVYFRMKKIERLFARMSDRRADQITGFLAGTVFGLLLGYFVYAWAFWELAHGKA